MDFCYGTNKYATPLQNYVPQLSVSTVYDLSIWPNLLRTSFSVFSQDNVQCALEMTRLQLDDHLGQGLGVQGKDRQAQKGFLQEELVTVRARLCDISVVGSFRRMVPLFILNWKRLILSLKVSSLLTGILHAECNFLLFQNLMNLI